MTQLFELVVEPDVQCTHDFSSSGAIDVGMHQQANQAVMKIHVRKFVTDAHLTFAMVRSAMRCSPTFWQASPGCHCTSHGNDRCAGRDSRMVSTSRRTQDYRIAEAIISWIGYDMRTAT